MATIPTYTAEGRSVQPRTPDYIRAPETGASALAEGFAHLSKSISIFDAKLREQQDESQATDAAARWEIGAAKIRDSLFTADPNDIQSGPEGTAGATIPAPREIEPIYKDKITALTDDLSKNLSPGAANLFNLHIARSFPRHVIDVRHGIRDVGIQHEVAGLDRMEESYAAMAVNPTLSNEERQSYINGYASALDRAAVRGMIDPVKRVERERSFEQKVLAGAADVLIATPERRAEFYARDAAGEFSKLNPVVLEHKRLAANRADERDERAGRANETLIQNARDDRKIEIGSLITQGNLPRATELLDFYQESRMLHANDIEHLREQIAKGPSRSASDQSIAQRVLLDVESINPKTTEAQIDDLVARQARGEPGLSLADGIKAKNQLRATRVALANRASDQTLAQNMREHAQAEQELQAALNIRPGIVASALQDDPNGRIYAQLLPELRKRSRAYGGTEAPLTVVDSMRPRIGEALKNTALKPSEIQALYPDWQSLDHARRENKISEDAFQSEVRRRSGAPVAQPPKAPVPQKRKRYGE